MVMKLITPSTENIKISKVKRANSPVVCTVQIHHTQSLNTV